MSEQFKNQQQKLEWPVMDEPERAREAAQVRLVQCLLNRLTVKPDKKLTPNLIRSFLQVCDIAVSFERIIYEDSTFGLNDQEKLPETIPNEVVLDQLAAEQQMRAVEQIPGIEDVQRISTELDSFSVDGIDSHLIMTLDRACETVWQKKETEERCKIQLEETDDSVQRAMIYLEMGNDEEAKREYLKISLEELQNPDNALDLVELTERFQDKAAALRVLKRWFTLGIVLHPLAYDLVADILFPRMLMSESVRIDNLRSILARCEIDSLDVLTKSMTLVLPAQIKSIPDPSEIDIRLKKLGASLQELNISFEENGEICLYTLLTELCTQLTHMAQLAKENNNRKLALHSLERCILTSLILFFLPQRQQDIQHVFGYGSYNLCHEWIVENLQESLTIFKEINPQTHTEKLIAGRLNYNFESLRVLAEKFAKKTNV